MAMTGRQDQGSFRKARYESASLFLSGHAQTPWHFPYCFIGYMFCNGHTRRSALSFYTTRFRFDRLAVYSFHRYLHPTASTFSSRRDMRHATSAYVVEIRNRHRRRRPDDEELERNTSYYRRRFGNITPATRLDNAFCGKHRMTLKVIIYFDHFFFIFSSMHRSMKLDSKSMICQCSLDHTAYVS